MPRRRSSRTLLLTTLGLLAALLAIPSSPAAAGAPSLVINEVDYAGGNQFIELRNLTGSAISLNGYSIDTESAEPETLLGSVPPNGHFAVCMSGQNTAGCGLVISTALTNGQGSVSLLLDGTPATTVDRVGWQGSANAEGTVSASFADPGAGKSLSRCADGNDTNSNALDMRGTTTSPGALNVCPTLVVNEVNYTGGTDFFELRNTSAITVDLTDYEVAYGGSASTGLQRFGGLSTLAPGEVRMSEVVNALPTPSGYVSIRSRYSAQTVDRVTWGRGTGGFTPEGSDEQLVDPDTDTKSPTGSQSMSRCGPDSNVNTDDFYGLPSTPGAANVCPTLLINEVDYNTGSGEVEFIELINLGSSAVDLFDFRFLIDNGSFPLDDQLEFSQRPTTLAAGARTTVCLGALTGCPQQQTETNISIDDGPGGLAIASRWSFGLVDLITWEGGGAFAPLEPGPATTSLADSGAGMSLSRCPDSTPAAGTLAGFITAAPSLNLTNTCTPPQPPALVINEVGHTGTDFIEVFNGTDATVDLAGYDLIVDPPRQQIVLNGSVAAGAYRTVCLNTTGCDQNVAGPTLPDGPSGIALRAPDTTVIDVLSWGNGGIAPDTLAEGAATTNLIDSGMPAGNSLSRCANGVDTNSNVTDFSLQARSLGLANPCTGPLTSTPTTPTGSGTVIIPTQDATQTSIAFSQLVFSSTGTFAGGGGPTEVLLASDTVFADALSSGSLQATRPLLLNNPDQLEDAVLTEIQRLGATTVRVLGGPAAISDMVITQLQAAGLTVSRVFGPTRLETAEQVAQLAQAPTSVIVGRAFPAPGGDDTQAFADTLAAGGWAAGSGQPILLSQTEVLSTTTDTYLGGSSTVTTAQVVGGEAALSSAVTDRLGALGIVSTRSSGATRFATAVAIANARGFNAGSPAATVILAEGQAANAWEAGFSAAGASSRFNAPVVLANGDLLPDETAAFLTSSVAAGTAQPTLICAASAAACAAAQQALGI